MYRVLSVTIFAVSLLLPASAPTASVAADTARGSEASQTPDCVYVGTPYDVIDAMLEAASIQRGDLVYDLGCGDGRIIVAAAKRFGCHGVGYDIDPQRIKECHQNVAKEKVGDLVEIKQEDIFTLDLGKVDVVMTYLLPEMNARLIPQLKKLKPGARIVTHNYSIEGIAPEKTVTMKSLEDGVKHYLFIYKAPLQEEDAQ